MIRIGIVGCGRILAAHLAGYRKLREAGVDNFRITALCPRRAEDGWMYVQRGKGPQQRKAVSDIPGDPLCIDDEFLSDFQDDVEVEVFTDFREMIAGGPIDAVNDFSIHSLHHQVAAEAFSHGKHLLTQKPLAVSVAAARRMCEQAEAADRVFGVFENARNKPITRQLQWLVQSGRIGKLQLIWLGFVGQWWAPNRIVAETPWRHRRIDGGGVTADMGVHFFDQLRYVTGEPQSVSGQIALLEPQRVSLDEQGRESRRIDCDAEDTFMANVEFENATVANLLASWSGHGAATKVGEGIVYHGSAGRVTGDEVTFDDGSSASLKKMYDTAVSTESKETHFPFGLTDTFALNQYDWLKAIQEQREPETSGREGLRDLAAACAILESHHAGRRVEVAEVLSGELRNYFRDIDQRYGL